MTNSSCIFARRCSIKTAASFCIAFSIVFADVDSVRSMCEDVLKFINVFAFQETRQAAYDVR
ncbi:MAG TPA: hypothetical protein DEX10_04835 [Betaproteobacteria bacterium]|nr:hypothetical protein [Betaproteobacteria bacterium]